MTIALPLVCTPAISITLFTAGTLFHMLHYSGSVCVMNTWFIIKPKAGSAELSVAFDGEFLTKPSRGFRIASGTSCDCRPTYISDLGMV
jgi:hypothetical protein